LILEGLKSWGCVDSVPLVLGLIFAIDGDAAFFHVLVIGRCGFFFQN
jgi:hypothetical protein